MWSKYTLKNEFLKRTWLCAIYKRYKLIIKSQLGRKQKGGKKMYQ